MFSYQSLAAAALTVLATSVDARPFEYFHGPPQWSQSYMPAFPFPTGTVATTGLPPMATSTGLAYSTGYSSQQYNATTITQAASYSTYPTHASISKRSTSSSAPAPVATFNPDMIRGVNLGGWLILEEWMTPDVFTGTSAVDQWTFDQTSGAQAKLQTHWETYFNETDMATIASWGLNAVRIPIGFWAYNNTGTPYISGADAYLEQAIGWARQYGVQVLIDCHGSPGSQNGYDNSGHAGNTMWQSGNNLNQSIAILETIAAKYGAAEYSDVVPAIEIVNEPLNSAPNSFATTKTWAKQAYHAMKRVATNQNLMIISHDSFMGQPNWEDVGKALNTLEPDSKAESMFALDYHLYQNSQAADNALTQDQHIQKACSYTTQVKASSNIPVYVGEFSASTNICAYVNGTTTGATSCSEQGCQCTSDVWINEWNQPLKDATTKFFEAQLDAFEHSYQGFFMWNYNGNGAWGMNQLFQYGIMGSLTGKITDRKFPPQCSFSS